MGRCERRVCHFGAHFAGEKVLQENAKLAEIHGNDVYRPAVLAAIQVPGHRRGGGIVSFDSVPYSWRYYFDAQIIVMAVIGAVGSTLFGSPRVLAAYHKFAAGKAGCIVQEICLLLIFALSVLFMVNSTYSPFIYFQY